jgi:glutathione S-transferase
MDDKPVLYYDECSPPVRSVLLTIAALGIEDIQLRKVALFEREHLKDDFLKVN